MAVREFNSLSEDWVRFPPSNRINNFTIAVLLRWTPPQGSNNQGFVWHDNSLGNWQVEFEQGQFAELGLDCSGTYSNTFGNLTVGTADGWMIAVARHPTPGNPTQFSKYVLSTDTLVHVNGSPNAANPNEQDGNIFVGAWPSGFDWPDIKIALVAEWQGLNMTNAQTEELTVNLATADWLNHSGGTPTLLWEFNQTAVTDPVLDLVGNLDQEARSGTTVVTDDDPPGWTFFTPPQQLHPDADIDSGDWV